MLLLSYWNHLKYVRNVVAGITCPKSIRPITVRRIMIKAPIAPLYTFLTDSFKPGTIK